jgi:hypothetical protein
MPIRNSAAYHVQIVWVVRGTCRYDGGMLTDEEIKIDRTRVIAICLNEADWRALVGVEPEPVDWVRRQIRARISSTESGNPPAETNRAAGTGAP